MGIRASLLWIVGACVLSFSCGDSSTDGAGSHAGAGGSVAGDSSDGGADHAGTGNRAGASHGGSTGSAGAETTAGAAGLAGAGQDPGEAGTAGAAGALEAAGAAGQSDEPARFEPWALWPMPNAASSGLPNPASYDTSTPGVVLDKVTGLVWQAAVPPSTHTWADAKAYCANLELGGFIDWRLPSRIELVSIVDYTIAKPGPVVDATVFPSTPNTLFWTASPVALYGGSRAWYVEFDNGFAFTEATSAEYNVRCVRAGLTTTTGLTWQHTDAGATYTFSAAHQHCADLGAGWRVPSVKELLTIVDESRANPAVDSSLFTSIPNGGNLVSCYQTSTPLAGTAISWLVCFDAGRPTYDSSSNAYRALCVK